MLLIDIALPNCYTPSGPTSESAMGLATVPPIVEMTASTSSMPEEQEHHHQRKQIHLDYSFEHYLYSQSFTKFNQMRSNNK
jgi:hypothetical protein